MKENNLIITLLIVSVFLGILASGIAYFSLDGVIGRISGRATDGGNITLIVEAVAAVNFTRDVVNFSSGRVNPGSTAASLFTVESGTVTGGNWTASGGLLLENTGSTNVSLNLSVGKNASQFIGGSNPVYEWNLSSNETHACVSIAGNNPPIRFNIFYPANTTPSTALGGLGCSVLRFESTSDMVRIDFNLTIPENSQSGTLIDSIHAIATVV